jgi:hypothetical protein
MGRLEEIRDEMLELLEEAKKIVRDKRKTHRMVYERMMSYWYPHIKMGLTSDHEFLGSDTNMQEAIDAIDGDDSLEALIAYAEENDVDSETLAKEMEIDKMEMVGTDNSVAAVIKHALEVDESEPQWVRECIDACQ